jgi:hypothetical protein
MPHPFEAIITDSQRRAHRPEELSARSLSIWDELKEMIQSTPYTIDEWAEVAKKTGGTQGMFFAAHLEVIKSHLKFVEKRKKIERPRALHFNTIPPSRLVKKV